MSGLHNVQEALQLAFICSSNTQYSTRNAAYDLAKLRRRSLVHPVEHSRHRRAVPAAVRVMCAYLLLRDELILASSVGTPSNKSHSALKSLPGTNRSAESR